MKGEEARDDEEIIRALEDVIGLIVPDEERKRGMGEEEV